jgi:eukaryotic-like serine/threonine-protein kinase
MRVASLVRRALTLTLGLASLLAAASPPLSAATLVDWPQLGFDPGHTGFNPAERTLTPGHVTDLGHRWAGGIARGAPIEAGGRVFALVPAGPLGSEPPDLRAFDAVTGAALWTATAPGTCQFSGQPVHHAGRVIVGLLCPGTDATTGKLIAADAATGATVWTTDYDQAISDLAVGADGTVYAVSNGVSGFDLVISVLAVDPADGHILWATPAPGENALAPPVVGGGLVYTHSKTAATAYDATTGTLVWRVALASADPCCGTIGDPVLAGGTLYVGGDTDVLYAINAATGAIRWQHQFPPTDLNGPGPRPAVANGVVYLSWPGNATATLYALDAATGATMWSKAFASRLSAPAIGAGVVYVSERAALHALLAVNGRELRALDLPAEEIAPPSPIVVNGFVYAGLTAFSG